MRSLWLGLLLAVLPARKPQVFATVKANGSVMQPKRPTLNLTGPFACTDNSTSPGSTDCACPNTGVLAQGLIQFVVQQQGAVDIAAPWVTMNTIVSCTPMGSVPAQLSISELRPGNGFTVVAQVPDVLLGVLSIGCIGAVAQ